MESLHITQCWPPTPSCLKPLPPLIRTRPDSGARSLDDLDGDDEDGRLVIDDVDRDHLTLKENVLNLKSDKPRKKHLRFNGMPEEEVAKRLLPDLIKDNLDILIVRIFLLSITLFSTISHFKKHFFMPKNAFFLQNCRLV